MAIAQDWLKGKTDPATTTKIGTTGTWNGKIVVQNPYGTDKLTGELIIKDYVELEELNLDQNELEKITFINCPKLKKISVASNRDTGGNPKLETINIEKLDVDTDGNPKTNALTSLDCGFNKIVKVDFTYCQNLIHFGCPENPTLDWIINIDYVEGIETINMKNSGPVRIMHATKEAVFRGVVNEVKELFGVDHAGKLPMVKKWNPKTKRMENRVDGIQLKKDLEKKIMDVQNPKLTKEVNEAREKLETQKDYDTIKAKLEKLEQESTAIKNKLGLTESATNQQALDEIEKLKNRPTSSCSHNDYETIKTERDQLKTENTKLKNDNKENESVITKTVLAETTNTNWKNWGVKISDDQKEKILSAVSAEKVEEIRNEIIKDEFKKMNSENNSSFYLNIGLGVLAVGSLLVLSWVLLARSNLPITEPEKDKKK